MKVYQADQIKNISLLGSSGSGKTTLAEAMLFEGGAWYFAFKEFRKAKGGYGYIQAVQRGKDPSMFVVLLEDSAAMVGLIVAFLGVLLAQVTGINYFDGAASVIIGLILGPMTEHSLRKSLMMFRGDLHQFLNRPIAMVFFSLVGAVILFKILYYYLYRRPKLQTHKA